MAEEAAALGPNVVPLREADGRNLEPLEDPGRPVVRIVAGELPRVVSEVEDVLVKYDHELYQRGGQIVRVVDQVVKGVDESETLAAFIKPVGADHLRERAQCAADFQKYSKREKAWLGCDLLKDYAETLIARGQWSLRTLSGVVAAPTLRADGSLLETQGYDQRTGILFQSPAQEFPPVPPAPSRDEGQAALQKLRDLVDSFPFIGSVDKTVWLSALLTGIHRRTLTTAPAHAFQAPIAGSGKSLLVDLVSIILTGWPAPVVAPHWEEPQMETRIDSMLIGSPVLFSIDNVAAPLDSVALCQTLSQQWRSIRLFHHQSVVEVPTTISIFITGNNLRLMGDLTRRALLCSLDPGCERPELREFEKDIAAETKARRVELAVAALTALRAFVVANPVPTTHPLGGFEQWSRRIRDCLIWYDEPDPLSTMAAARDADPVLEALGAVMLQWAEVIGEEQVSVGDAIKRAGQREVIGSQDLRYPDFRDALLTVAADGHLLSSTKLGKWLTRHQNRIVSGMKFVRAGSHGGAIRWQLRAP